MRDKAINKLEEMGFKIVKTTPEVIVSIAPFVYPPAVIQGIQMSFWISTGEDVTVQIVHD